MARKAIVTQLKLIGTGTDIAVEVGFTNSADSNIDDPEQFNLNMTGITSSDQIMSMVNTAIMNWSAANSYGITASDIIWNIGKDSLRAQSALTMSIVTGTGATGSQISATNDALINVNATIVTAATLAAGAVGTLVLEIASTNSATAGDWVEIGRLTNGQVFSLAVAIGCTQTISGQLGGYVPKGYYAKLRSISTTGTPTYSYNSGQKALL